MPRRLTIRCQWRLKYFLLLMVVLAIAMAWWSRSASVQRNAVRALESQGFVVFYTWLPYLWDGNVASQRTHGLLSPGQYDRLPNVVKRFLDKHYFVSAACVSTRDHTHRTVDVSPIRHLRGLQSIALDSVAVTDDSLAVLHSCDCLEVLSVRDVTITDDALVHVGRLQSLRDLTLTEVRISDNGLQHLRPLRKLVKLQLEGTLVTYDGIDDLQRWLPNCQVNSGVFNRISNPTPSIDPVSLRKI